MDQHMKKASKILSLIGLAALAACGGGGQPSPKTPDSLSQKKDSLPPIPRQAIKLDSAFVNGLNLFGLDLLAKIQEQNAKENLTLSPLSLYTNLSLLANGANAGTLQEFNKLLYVKGEWPQWNEQIRQLRQNIQMPDSGYTLLMGNALWMHQKALIEAPIKERAQSIFGAGVQAVDFADPKVVGQINQWASEQTKGKIPEVVKELSSDLQFFLANAVYFKGQWQRAFEASQTSIESFYTAELKEQKVSMMSFGEPVNLPYWENQQNLMGLELPYKGKSVVMYLFTTKGEEGSGLGAKPSKPVNIQSLILSLRKSQPWASPEAWVEREVMLRMPKFTNSTEYIFQGEDPKTNLLHQMGLKLAFGLKADFTGWTKESPRVFLSFVKHQCVIEVNEQGTEAAAVTTSGLATKSAPMFLPFILNRPFVYAIYDKYTRSLLFLGTVNQFPNQ